MPTKKPIQKTTISDAQLKVELIKLFESGNTDKGKCREILGSKYKIQVQRFYKTFAIALQEWQETKNKATAEQIQANTIEAVKKGLKSKIERVLALQSQIDELKGKLELNQDFKYLIVAGKVQKVVCEIDLSTRAYLHKTIKDIQAEISKIEGDYAINKHEINSIVPVLNFNFPNAKGRS